MIANSTRTVDSVDGLLGRVANEFFERLAAGEHPDVEEYAARHPDIAALIREIFPALDFVRDSVAANSRPAPADGIDPERCQKLGDFRILRELGRGGMGVVYEAEQLSIGRRVALKVLPFAALVDQKALQRFQNEVRAAATLDHPHITAVYSVGEERGVHHYAMQLVRGQSLAAVLNELVQSDRKTLLSGSALSDAVGALAETRSEAFQSTIVSGPPHAVNGRGKPSSRTGADPAYYRAVARLGVQAAEALQHAHERGVVHRDIKPGNLLLDSDGKLWVTDFGLARLEADAGLTMTGDLVGTLRYMSPEQALAKRVVVDHRTDIYSLGATLYELLTLRAAFAAEDRAELLRQIAFEEPRPPRQIDPGVPRELETIVLCALSKNPGERYDSAENMAADLRALLDNRPIRARPPTLLKRATKCSQRHRPLVVSLAVILLLLMLGVGWSGWEYSQRRRSAELLVNAALQAAATQRATAVALGDDLAAWSASVAEAQRAASLADAGPVSTRLREQVTDLLSELQRERDAVRTRLDQDERDRRMLRLLGEARMCMLRMATVDRTLDDELFEQAFESYGIPVLDLEIAEAAARIRERNIREELVEALIDWSYSFPQESRSERYLLAVADQAASNQPPWHKPLISALLKRDLQFLRQAATATRESPPMAASGMAQLAVALGEAGDVDLAIETLVPIQQRFPNELLVSLALAELFIKATPPRLSEAIRCLTAAVAVEPQSAGASFQLGLALQKNGELEAAVVAYRRAITLAPGFASFHNNLGVILKEIGDIDAAMSSYRRAIELDPEYVFAHVNLGRALVERGQFDMAISEFQCAIDLDPQHVSSYMNLGNCLSRCGDTVAAETAYRRALQISPGSPKLHFNLANLLGDTGQRDAAIASYRQAVELDPDFAEAYNNLGVELGMSGQFAAAVTELRRAVELEPNRPDFRVNLSSAENCVQFDERLRRFLLGELEFDSNDERIQLASFVMANENTASGKRDLFAAARLYRDALTEEPSLGADVETPHRYNAACSASLASVEADRPHQRLSDANRADMRTHARDWLTADLNAWQSLADSSPDAHPKIAETLARWQSDPDLAPVRDAEPLAQLPDAERQQWQAMWARVEQLRAACANNTLGSARPPVTTGPAPVER